MESFLLFGFLFVVVWFFFLIFALKPILKKQKTLLHLEISKKQLSILVVSDQAISGSQLKSQKAETTGETVGERHQRMDCGHANNFWE